MIAAQSFTGTREWVEGPGYWVLDAAGFSFGVWFGLYWPNINWNMISHISRFAYFCCIVRQQRWPGIFFVLHAHCSIKCPTIHNNNSQFTTYF